MIRGYKGIRPTAGARAFVDVSAQVIADVELGDATNDVGHKEAYRAEAEEGA